MRIVCPPAAEWLREAGTLAFVATENETGATGGERAVGAATPTVAVLLAGGLSRRAGLDKRYLVLGGQTLLQRNVRFLRRLFPEVVVSHARGQEPDLGDDAEVRLLPDTYPGHSPLAGIVTALERLGGPLFVMASDLACPTDAAAHRVVDAAAASRADVTLPRVGPHREPLFAVYGPHCLPPMRASLLADHHRIAEAFQQLRVEEVLFPDARPFHNINTMDEFDEARRRIEAVPIGGADAGEAGARPALVAIVGKSDSGKTTLIERLLPELRKLGLRVGTVKHDAHGFEIDHPGKDSWRHGQAGAEAYAISSPGRLAFVARLDEELPLGALARRYFDGFDLVLAEGYKRSAAHRIEVFRAAAGHAEPLCAAGEALALVTDTDWPHEQRFTLDDPAGLARFIAVRLDALRRY